MGDATTSAATAATAARSAVEKNAGSTSAQAEHVAATAQALRDKYRTNCQALEDAHLDQAIEQELQGAPWLSPFLPSSPEAMSAFVTFAGLTSNDVILDIGCGDGRVLVTMTKVFGCRGIGIDVSEACTSSAAEIARAEGIPAELLSWHCADATRSQIVEELRLREATVVFLYAYPTLLAKLKKLLERLRTGGARVFTLQYHLDGEGWNPSKAAHEPINMRLYEPMDG